LYGASDSKSWPYVSAGNSATMSNPTSGALSPTPEEQDLHRQLIQQFYENSIKCYGPEHEQTQLFAQHLSAYTSAGE
jgi:hypothetical protein